MERRDFIKATVLGSTVLAGMAAASPRARADEPAMADRDYWRGLLTKIATPVLANMSKGALQKNMPVELSPIWDGRDRRVTYMECFARLMSGLAPWLTAPASGTAEDGERKRLTEWAVQSFVHSVDPRSPDYLLWRKEAQPLVDSAYFSNALMLAPKQLW